MEVVDIYAFIARFIADNIKEDGWQKAYMLIERQEGMVAYRANKYVDDSVYIKPFTVRNRQDSMQVSRLLNQLHSITTAGGHTRWNFLWFALLPSGAYELEFVWNQDAEDVLAHLGQTKGLREPARSQALRAFERAQAERRAGRVYARLVQAVMALIPEAWTTAWVSLREAGLGLIEHRASYQPADSALYITQNWAALRAVEELRALKTEGHPDWQQVTFEITVGGTYRAAFTTQNGPADDYAYEGQWPASTTS